MSEKKYAYFAVKGEDGHPRACHALVGFQPEGSIEITEAHARQIAADVRAREVKDEEAAAPAGYVTEERARALAAEAANIAVRAFAAEIAKSTGGSP